jgi:MoaA/NifB/PqqE/SkfB family radical SAM enzyme
VNKYINLNRLEFVITNNCSGKCKHCSVENTSNNETIDQNVAVNIINEISKDYKISSIMTFGGEPLLYADTVCKIHETAFNNNIDKREIITNGHFSKDYEIIDNTAMKICKTNVKRILLSVDYFHQESIPIEYVLYFAKSLLKNSFTELKTHPAWLINEKDNNKYRLLTSTFRYRKV